MEVTIYPNPWNLPERSTKWPNKDEKCPRCGQPFGHYKKIKLANGLIIHKKCAKQWVITENGIVETE